MWWCHVAHSTFYPKMFNHLSHGETYLSDIFRFRPTNCLRTSMLVTLSSTCLTGYKAMVLSLERIRRKSTKLSHTLKWISVLSSCKPTVVHQSPLYYSRHWFAFITPSQNTILKVLACISCKSKRSASPFTLCFHCTSCNICFVYISIHVGISARE